LAFMAWDAGFVCFGVFPAKDAIHADLLISEGSVAGGDASVEDFIIEFEGCF
jgi:hypothetical protein